MCVSSGLVCLIFYIIIILYQIYHCYQYFVLIWNDAVSYEQNPYLFHFYFFSRRSAEQLEIESFHWTSKMVDRESIYSTNFPPSNVPITPPGLEVIYSAYWRIDLPRSAKSFTSNSSSKTLVGKTKVCLCSFEQTTLFSFLSIHVCDCEIRRWDSACG